MSDDKDPTDFLLPLRWKKKVRGRARPFTIADEPTLSKILGGNGNSLQPEFHGREYLRGIKNEDKRVFKCDEPQCGETFTKESSLKIHRNKHRGSSCSFCGGALKGPEELAKHLQEFHPDLDKIPEADPHQCKKCSKISRDKMALRRHIQKSHPPHAYPCPHCHYPFTSPDNLKVHLKHKHPPKDAPVAKWPCEICGKEYPQKINLRAHIKYSHRGDEGASYRCVVCDTIYDNRRSYRRHMSRHVNPKFFPCKICKVQFGTMSHYKRHVDGLWHQQRAGRQGKEPEETNMEAIASEMKPDRKSDKPPMKKSFTNEELISSCQEKVIKIILVRVDQRAVIRPSVHPAKALCRRKGHHYLNCIYCDLNLPNLEGVKTHEAICLMKMKNKKLHICPQCNKEFNKASVLARHAKTHSEDRPFQCSYCDTKFKQRDNLVQHEKSIHFGIRREVKPRQVFRCSRKDCQKQFSTPKALRRHWESIHLEIRHPCGTCGKVFKRQEQLRSHRREEHAKNPILLPCRTCKRTYRNKQALLGHYQTERHRKKSRELCRRQFESKNKEEMKDELPEEEPSSALPIIISTYSLKEETCLTNEASIPEAEFKMEVN